MFLDKHSIDALQVENGRSNTNALETVDAALIDTNATSRSNRTFVDIDLDAKPVHLPAH